MSFPSLPGLAGSGLANLPTLPSLSNYALPGVPGLGGLGAAPQPAPDTQKGRDIAFQLNDLTYPENTVGQLLKLTIRPEELTRTETSRVAVHQTLGGAFADSFGTGLPMINISGHTGWRRQASGDDGEARFRMLRDTAYVNWHKLRQDATRAGKDPAKVQLVFVDELDWFSSVVIPLSFTLRRSKSRPLLLQFQIQMVVVDEQDTRDTSSTVLSNIQASKLGIASLQSSVSTMNSQAAIMQSFVPLGLAGPLSVFTVQSAALFQSVSDLVTSGLSVSPTLLDVAKTVALAGTNVLRMVATLGGMTQAAMGQIMLTAAAFSNALCVLINSIATEQYYNDYSQLLGASNCSSTTWGSPLSPLAGVNPFFIVAPVDTPGVSLSVASQAALKNLAATDVVLAPMSAPVIASTVATVNAGMVVGP